MIRMDNDMKYDLNCSKWQMVSILPMRCLYCQRHEVWSILLMKLAPEAQSVDFLLRGTGGHGFSPRLRHTKVIKNGTSSSLLGTQTYGIELGLVDRVSG